MRDKDLRKKISNLVTKYYTEHHRPEPFVPGKTRIPYAGRVYDEKEMTALVSSALDFWLTAGPYAEKLEKYFRGFFNAKGFYLVNSGSSANLIMISSLKSLKLKTPLKQGDEVITPAVTFPTTLTPILQNGLVPVFIDCDIGTYNIAPRFLEQAVGPKTKAIFVPHTLGNPAHMDIVMEVAKKHGLYVLEDACDALGAEWDGKLVGTFGNMASLSFYPAHHMTTGEGGGVIVNDSRFEKISLSMRDWGRDCWCEPGKNNSCGRRFNGQHGKLPLGYDHKYVYSHLGYNLKLTDLQAAIGVAQFEKLPSFIEARRKNFTFYYEQFKDMEEKIILPKWESKARPSWFGFPITVREGIDAKGIVENLEDSGIETRKIFAGNILKQPGFLDIPHRVAGDLRNTDQIMARTFFIGVYPGLRQEMKEYVVQTLRKAFKDV
ncbi:MAG: lipopolysaccharide biosynthesis protein RfbH [Candidatus Omnitrophica bacterium]|nr:lipopolysaccharide biosynthesis protein RfbH [Candidatus Omnitrophota bacterium]